MEIPIESLIIDQLISGLTKIRDIVKIIEIHYDHGCLANNCQDIYSEIDELLKVFLKAERKLNG